MGRNLKECGLYEKAAEMNQRPLALRESVLGKRRGGADASTDTGLEGVRAGQEASTHADERILPCTSAA